MRVSTFGVIVVAVAASAAAVARQQGDRPQFRAGVELIQLDVAVLDDKRLPVRGLTEADFTVLEDGVERAIRAFTPVELAPRARAAEAVWASEIAPDVATNRVAQDEGRLVVILMDRSVPVEEPTIIARKIATAAIDELGPNDLGAVITTSHGVVQNLTADRARLRRAINASDPAVGISADAKDVWAALGVTYDPFEHGGCICNVCVLETITRVADALQNTPRRRKILFFIGSGVTFQTSGSDTAADTLVGCAVRLKDARNAMFAAVDRANLTVHSLDPQGLLSVGPQTRASAITRPGGGAGRLAQQQEEARSTISARQSLDVLTSRTGGRTVAHRNNPEQTVPAIYRESEAYYVLGVERDPSATAGRPKSLEVKVKRKGVHVYAQRQYIVPSTGSGNAPMSRVADAPLSPVEAMGRLLPTASRPLALAVTAFANPSSSKAIVRVNVDVGAFAPADGTSVPLDVTVLAVDQTGRPVASARQTSTVSVSGRAGRSTEVNVQSHLELAKGDYGIRVAVSDPAKGSVASVFSDITVPRFDDDRLSLSDLSVEIASAPAAPPAPTTLRVFRPDHQVRAVLQIYQGTQRDEPIVPVSMRVQVVDAKGAAVRDQALPFGESAFTNRRADCVISLPLAKLPPGEYALKLEASAAGRQPVTRALRFTVALAGLP